MRKLVREMEVRMGNLELFFSAVIPSNRNNLGVWITALGAICTMSKFDCKNVEKLASVVCKQNGKERRKAASRSLLREFSHTNFLCSKFPKVISA